MGTKKEQSNEQQAPKAKTFTGQSIADTLGVEGIVLRRYIRSDGTRVGRGKVYSFTKDQAKEIALGFTKSREKDATEKELAEVAALFDEKE